MKSNIVKNTIMLYGLSIAKILFPLATLPYLTRVLSVEVYGVVSYVKSLMQYMQLLVDFGFLLSGTKEIVKARDNRKEISGVVSDVLLAKLLLATVTFIFVILFASITPIIKNYRLLTILTYGNVFLSIFLFDFFFRGIEQMQVITIRFVLMKSITTLLTFFMVHSDDNILLIPVLDIIGSSVAIILVMINMKKMDIHIKISSYKNAFKKLYESAVFFMSSMATTAFGALNTLLIGCFLSASDIAFWSVSIQIIGGIQAMYSPIIDGVFPEMVKCPRLGIIKRILMTVMPLILVGSAVSFFLAKQALVILGGNRYIDATLVFRSLIPVLIFSFPGMLLGWPTLGAIDKARQVTTSTVTSALFQIAGLVLLLSINRFDIVSIALLRCATELLMLVMRAGYVIQSKEKLINHTI